MNYTYEFEAVESLLKIGVETPYPLYSYRLAFYVTRFFTIYVKEMYFAKQE